jgi:hypothetical protein
VIAARFAARSPDARDAEHPSDLSLPAFSEKQVPKPRGTCQRKCLRSRLISEAHRKGRPFLILGSRQTSLASRSWHTTKSRGEGHAFDGLESFSLWPDDVTSAYWRLQVRCRPRPEGWARQGGRLAGLAWFQRKPRGTGTRVSTLGQRNPGVLLRLGKDQ